MPTLKPPLLHFVGFCHATPKGSTQEELVSLFYDAKHEMYVHMGASALALGQELGYGQYQDPVNLSLIDETTQKWAENVKKIETGAASLTDSPSLRELVEMHKRERHVPALPLKPPEP